MSEKKPADEVRAKYLEALNKKKLKRVAGAGAGPVSGSKIEGASGNTTKRFQRKSGSA